MFFFFKQKTAYEIGTGDWSSDVCSSDLIEHIVRWIPPLHILYAYRPTETGETFIQPIYVTRKRPGLLGWVVTHLLLWLTRLSYYALRGEDGMIYDNIRFSTERLLPVDAPIARYVKYVNGLVPSSWSRRPLPKTSSTDRDDWPVPSLLSKEQKLVSSPTQNKNAELPPEYS